MSKRHVRPDWADVADSALLLAWNGLVLGVTTYLVFWKGHSGWWFLLALTLLATKTKEEA